MFESTSIPVLIHWIISVVVALSVYCALKYRALFLRAKDGWDESVKGWHATAVFAASRERDPEVHHSWQMLAHLLRTNPGALSTIDNPMELPQDDGAEESL
jgi:hypothetical protein